MYIRKVLDKPQKFEEKKQFFVDVLKVRIHGGIDPRIRISTKISWIRNTAYKDAFHRKKETPFVHKCAKKFV
jgi:hypothetical protein